MSEHTVSVLNGGIENSALKYNIPFPLQTPSSVSCTTYVCTERFIWLAMFCAAFVYHKEMIFGSSLSNKVSFSVRE